MGKGAEEKFSYYADMELGHWTATHFFYADVQNNKAMVLRDGSVKRLKHIPPT